jgi:FMN phosphatase YigB (HAD superfamily)
MSLTDRRGDMSSSDRNKPVVFLDYGELIMHYDFNRDTLMRAHKLALPFINEHGAHMRISMDELSFAHDGVMKAYVNERRETLKETSMNWLMVRLCSILNVRLGSFLYGLANIYANNDHDVSPMPGTIESIPELQNMARLGIISNLPHDSIKSELERYGLKDTFNPMVISHEVGWRKPNPKIYIEAYKRAQVAPNQATFFSHDREEVRGAKDVGMQAHLAYNLTEVVSKLKKGAR